MLAVTALAFGYGGAAGWALISLSNRILAFGWLLVALLFVVSAGLLAARRRTAIVTYWLAFLAVITLRMVVALGPSELPHRSRPLDAAGLLVLGVLGLWISRRRMRTTLR